MKIGILTFHFAHNYGAVLQCYALQEYLKSTGHDVSVIDYRPRHIASFYALYSRDKIRTLNLKGKIKYIGTHTATLLRRYIRKTQFDNYIDRYLKTVPYDNSPYDILVYGSDQIWSKYICENDRTYWGVNELRTAKSITYSASAGQTGNFEQQDIDFIRSALKIFSAISVRESQLQQFIRPLTTKQVDCTADPVFLLDKSAWERLIGTGPHTSKYILVYNLYREQTIRRMADELQRKTGYRIIELCGEIGIDDLLHPQRKTCEDPISFVRLIRNAEIVLSSSFHGTAFSILFNKKFYVYQSHNSARVKSLLDNLGIGNRFTDSLSVDPFADIDYISVNKKLQESIDRSKKYLTDNL